MLGAIAGGGETSGRPFIELTGTVSSRVVLVGRIGS